MTEEQFETLKESYIDHLKEFIKSEGGIFPHISIFAEHIDNTDDKPALVHIPIPDEFMESDKSKTVFVNEVIPELAITVKEKFIVKAVAWSSEAWVRETSNEEEIEDYKELPITKEILLIIIDSKDGETFMSYDIERLGTQVNNEGKLTNNINLIENKTSMGDGTPSIGGKFSGLFKKFDI
jgi:hypothetical protein